MPRETAVRFLEFSGNEYQLTTEAPAFLKQVHLKQWHRTPDGRVVHPDLVPFMLEEELGR